jgi:hypothetical protein
MSTTSRAYCAILDVKNEAPRSTEDREAFLLDKLRDAFEQVYDLEEASEAVCQTLEVEDLGEAEDALDKLNETLSDCETARDDNDERALKNASARDNAIDCVAEIAVWLSRGDFRQAMIETSEYLESQNADETVMTSRPGHVAWQTRASDSVKAIRETLKGDVLSVPVMADARVVFAETELARVRELLGVHTRDVAKAKDITDAVNHRSARERSQWQADRESWKVREAYLLERLGEAPVAAPVVAPKVARKRAARKP